MKNFIAIVKSTDGKLDKYQDFAIEADAVSHVGQYGGFVVPDPGGQTSYWVVDEAAKTVVNNQAQADADALASSWDRLRTERDQLLHDTDWWASGDLSITEAQTTYRQTLRDLPANTADPTDVTWPEAPE